MFISVIHLKCHHWPLPLFRGCHCTVLASLEARSAGAKGVHPRAQPHWPLNVTVTVMAIWLLPSEVPCHPQQIPCAAHPCLRFAEVQCSHICSILAAQRLFCPNAEFTGCSSLWLKLSVLWKMWPRLWKGSGEAARSSVLHCRARRSWKKIWALPYVFPLLSLIQLSLSFDDLTFATMKKTWLNKHNGDLRGVLQC